MALNKLKIIIAGLVSLSFSQVSFAEQSSSDPVLFEAALAPTLGITIVLHQNSSTGPEIPSMNFGSLVEFTNPNTSSKTLRSSTAGSTGTGSVVVMIYPQPTGKPYHVDSSGGVLTNATGDTIPPGASSVVPIYSPQDNDFGGGPLPLVGQLGDPGSWVVSSPGRRIYTSDAAGDYRAIQAHFSITDDQTAGATSAVPIDQRGGAYSGTVVFTITE